MIPQESCVRLLRLKEEMDPQADVVMLPYQTAFDEEGQPSFSFERERIVRNDMEILFMWMLPYAMPRADQDRGIAICASMKNN